MPQTANYIKQNLETYRPNFKNTLHTHLSNLTTPVSNMLQPLLTLEGPRIDAMAERAALRNRHAGECLGKVRESSQVAWETMNLGSDI